MLVQILLSLLSKKCPTEDRVLFVLMKMKQRNGISCCCIDCHFVLLYRLSDMFIIVVSQVQILMECSYNLGQFCLKDEIVWCILVKYVNFRKRVGHYAISSQTTFGSTFVPYLYLHQHLVHNPLISSISSTLLTRCHVYLFSISRMMVLRGALLTVSWYL